MGTTTAKQIARALGEHPFQVRRWLAGTSFMEGSVRGQKAKIYSIGSLPAWILDKLTDIAGRKGYAGIEALLADPSPIWQPAIPFSEIDPKQVSETELRRDILAPILRHRGTLAESSLIRRAASAWKGRPLSDSSIRRLIRSAFARDAGREEWERVELYLPERLAAKPSEPQRKTGSTLPLLTDALSSLENPSRPGREEVFSIVILAMREIESLCSQGLDPSTGMKAVLDTIIASSVTISKTRHSLRQRLWKAWGLWTASGGDIEKLRDGRSERSGRNPEVVPTPEEIAKIRALVVEAESVTFAARYFAKTSPDCSPELAEAILRSRSSKHKLPQTLRAAFGVAPVIIAQHKSPKNARLIHFTQPRDGTFIDKSNNRPNIRPGDLFERDDMSINCLFWVPWPWGGDPCSDRFGVRICRGQLLVGLDVGSQRFTSFHLVARPQDSYRADDIFQWVGHDYETIGKPRIGERLERGIWEAKKINGVIRPDFDPNSHTALEKRIGGLAALGVARITSCRPSGKCIESRFNILQRAMAFIRGQIGRKRGEFERETSLWMKCKAGTRDPREYFHNFSEMLELIEEALRYCNGEPIEGTKFHGVPDELWFNSIAEAPLQTVPPEKLWVFARDLSEITIRKSYVCIRKRAEDRRQVAWWFTSPELWRHEGKRVRVFYDSFAPEAGATIVDYADNLIARADFVEGCPQFSLSADARDEASSERYKAYKNAVVSEMRTIDLDPAKRRRMSKISDGAGTEHILARGTPQNTAKEEADPGMDLMESARRLNQQKDASRSGISLRSDRYDFTEDELSRLAADEAKLIDSQGGPLL